MRLVTIASMIVGLVVASSATAAPNAPASIRDVEVVGPRLRLGDAYPMAPLPDLDLGPVPAPFGSRLLSKADVATMLSERGVTMPANAPATVRVIRKMKKMSGPEVEAATRNALPAVLPRGVTLLKMRAATGISIPAGSDRTSIELAKLPHRVGRVSATLALVFHHAEEEIARVPVTVVLDVDAAAAAPDVARGSVITLIVRQGGVEIATSAVARDDANIGESFAVTVKGTGRSARAKLLDKGRAEFEESP